jgi:hypothetical protein
VRRADTRQSRTELRDAIHLAFIPMGVGLFLAMLLLPRRAFPDDVPVPIADARELGRAAAVDRDLAALARREPLPGTVRALGSAIRAYHVLEARGDARDLGKARAEIDGALVEALPGGDEPLRRLRAVELEGFLEELSRFESTGVESEELVALAGGFVRSMVSAGWCQGHTITAGADARRAMFKQMWNSFLGFDGKAAFGLSLDEQRALYALFLSHPHPTSAIREAIVEARRGAHDAKACQALVEAERASTEAWRLEHIARFASLDPSYPAAYAHGVASFRRGDYTVAARDFQAWVTAHPDGPLSLRAQSYLRAAAGREGAE